MESWDAYSIFSVSNFPAEDASPGLLSSTQIVVPLLFQNLEGTGSRIPVGPVILVRRYVRVYLAPWKHLRSGGGCQRGVRIS